MTDSKLVLLDSMANAAMRQAATAVVEQGEEITQAQLMKELEVVLGAPAKAGASLVPPEALKPPKVTDARSPATLQQAGLSLLDPEVDMARAFARVGVTREMIPQLMESPDWAGTMARICQQYMYVTHLPKIVSAQIKQALLGNTNAAKFLGEMFGKSDLDKLDEQTRALSEADPKTLVRHTEALIEDLQRLVGEAKGSGSSPEMVEAARVKAIADAKGRKVSPR